MAVRQLTTLDEIGWADDIAIEAGVQARLGADPRGANRGDRNERAAMLRLQRFAVSVVELVVTSFDVLLPFFRLSHHTWVPPPQPVGPLQVSHTVAEPDLMAARRRRTGTGTTADSGAAATTSPDRAVQRDLHQPEPQPEHRYPHRQLPGYRRHSHHVGVYRSFHVYLARESRLRTCRSHR